MNSTALKRPATGPNQITFWPELPAKPDQPAPRPAKESPMTHNRINEKVKVYALYKESADRRFPHDRLRPVLFVWRNREYRVQDVTYVWRENRGDSEVYHFTVSDGANVFELCYNARSLDWHLSGVYAE
jgi:hypothetical protein